MVIAAEQHFECTPPPHQARQTRHRTATEPTQPLVETGVTSGRNSGHSQIVNQACQRLFAGPLVQSHVVELPFR